MNKDFPHHDYTNEPERTFRQFIVQKQYPFNAEPPLPQLVQTFVTPTERFFKRNHGPIPDLSKDAPVTVHFPSSWRQHATSHASAWPASLMEPTNGVATCTFNLLQLEQHTTHFPKQTIVAAIECAGNRRQGLADVKKVKGVLWRDGTIGNAAWGGASLGFVLACALFSDSLEQAEAVERVQACRYSLQSAVHAAKVKWHVEFIAHGDSEEEARYAVSVPLDRVMDETKDVLLAWEMNGQPLARDHGFPLRIVVPGVIGARSVKWVSDIRILSHESASFYQQRDYKLLPPQCEERDLTRYWEILPALQELNVQSAICEPVHKSNVDATKPLVIRGYAMGGGGRSVQRVEVTLDNGKTWHFADVFRFQAPHGNAGSLDRDWSWCLWSLKLDCAGMGDNVEIAARACMHPFVCHSV